MFSMKIAIKSISTISLTSIMVISTPTPGYVIYVYNIVFNIYSKVHALCYTACNYIIKLAIPSIKGRKHFSKPHKGVN